MKRVYVNRHGISLVEVIVSTFLVGLLLVASLVSVGASARTTYSATESCDAIYLAQQLIEEITVLPCEDPNQTPIFGMELGESSGSTARTQADDIDDLKTWTESPPQDRSGNNLPNYIGWTRSVAVIPGTLSSDRKITVTVTAPSGRSTSLSAYRVKEGGSLQPQGVNQTLITWVGVTLQSGSGTSVSSGVSLINHATDQ